MNSDNSDQNSLEFLDQPQPVLIFNQDTAEDFALHPLARRNQPYDWSQALQDTN